MDHRQPRAGMISGIPGFSWHVQAKTWLNMLQGMGYRYCQIIQRVDGYGCSLFGAPAKPAELRSARMPLRR